MLEGKTRNLAHKISLDTARMLSDYMAAKIKRVAPKLGVTDASVASGYVYMAMLGGIIAAVAGVIEAVAQKNPDLAAKLREDIIEKVAKAGTQ
jgi:hypothetical protein